MGRAAAEEERDEGEVFAVRARSGPARAEVLPGVPRGVPGEVSGEGEAVMWVVDSNFDGPGERWLLKRGKDTIGAVTKSAGNDLVRMGYGPQVFSPDQVTNFGRDIPRIRPEAGWLVLTSLREAQVWCERAARVDIIPRLALAEVAGLA